MLRRRKLSLSRVQSVQDIRQLRFELFQDFMHPGTLTYPADNGKEAAFIPSKGHSQARDTVYFDRFSGRREPFNFHPKHLKPTNPTPPAKPTQWNEGHAEHVPTTMFHVEQLTTLLRRKIFQSVLRHFNFFPIRSHLQISPVLRDSLGVLFQFLRRDGQRIMCILIIRVEPQRILRPCIRRNEVPRRHVIVRHLKVFKLSMVGVFGSHNLSPLKTRRPRTPLILQPRLSRVR